MPGEICIFFPVRREGKDWIGEAEFYKYKHLEKNVSEEILEGNERLICSIPLGRYRLLHKDIYVYPPEPRPPRLVDVYNPYKEWLYVFEYSSYYKEISTYLLKGERFTKWCEFEAWWAPGAPRR